MGLIFWKESADQLSRDPPTYGLLGYVDSNFAGDSEDWKSVMGYCFFMNGAVISWSSKNQKTVFISITEVE